MPFKKCIPPSQTNNFEMRMTKDIKGMGTRKQMGISECPQVDLHHLGLGGVGVDIHYLGTINGFLTVTIKAQAI